MKEEVELNFCLYDGCLVGGDMWIPEAEWDYFPKRLPGYIGCNRVYCSSCNNFVQQRTGYSMAPYAGNDLNQRAPKLFSTSDWDSLQFLKKDSGGYERIYFCACHSLPTRTLVFMNGDSDHPIYGPVHPVSWKCNGHPPLEFPTSLYGQSIETSDDLKNWIQKIMEGEVKPAESLPKEEVNPEAFLISRLYLSLTEGDMKNEVDEIMASFLVHADPLFRSTAVVFFQYFPDSTSAFKLVQAYRDNPENFESVRHPYHKRGTYPMMVRLLVDLSIQVKNALRSIVENNGGAGAKELVRELILSGNFEPSWDWIIESIGLSWIEENLIEIYKAAPSHNLAPILLSQLEKPEKEIQKVIDQLKALDLLSKDEFEQEIPYQIEEKLTKN